MRAGFGTAVITPPLPVHLAGYGDRNEPAGTVHDDLEARVLLLEHDDTRAALVTCDLLAMTRDFSDPLRAAVAAACHLDRAAVLTSCTHVHAGPSTLAGTDAIGWPVPDGYRDQLAARVADAAHVAAATMLPVDPRFARTELAGDLAVNRRGHPLQPSAAVLVLDPLAVVANFGIHPTVTGPSNHTIATDWVGPFRRAVEDATGLASMFLQGCQGDVNPAVTAWDDGDPTAWAPAVDEFAAELAGCVVPAIARARPVPPSSVVARERSVRIPVGETLLAQLAGGTAERTVDLVDWQIGRLRVIGVPGEAFHAVEATLRAAHPDPLLLAGLAPDWHGYLPEPYTDGYEEGLSFGADAVAQLVEALRGTSA